MFLVRSTAAIEMTVTPRGLQRVLQFLLKMLHPRNPPNKESKIPLFEFNYNRNLNLNVYRARYRRL